MLHLGLPPIQIVFARYLGISGLFGIAFATRYTIDVWLVGALGGGNGIKFILVAVTFAGMLVGEVLGGWVSDHWNRRRGPDLATMALAAWALVASLAVHLRLAELLFVSSLAFGMSLGLYHSSLDAWFSAAVKVFAARPAGDGELLAGFFAYNSGYLIGGGLAFPSLFRFDWSAKVSGSPDLDTITILPFMTALLCAAMVWLLPLSRSDAVNRPTRPVERAHPLVTWLRDSRAILGSGGWGLAAAMLLGALINFLVQYIDHFAPADLLPGQIVATRTLNISALNLTVMLALGALLALLSRYPLARDLKPSGRLTLLFWALVLAGSLAGLAFLSKSWSGLATGITLGLAQSVLISLLPLFKAWMLSFGGATCPATALSVLGVLKRMLALSWTIGIYVTAPPTSIGDTIGDVEFLLLIAAIGLCCVIIAVWHAVRKVSSRTLRFRR